MIGKITNGASFRGLANYLEKEQDMEFKEAHNLAGDHKDHYVRMMEDTASMSKAEKPVYHVSLSYSEADNPSKEMMLEDGHQVLEEMGLGDHQAVFVAHQDTDHKHLHMMINRVNPDTGKAWDNFGDRYKLRGITTEIEKQRGYEKTRLVNPEKKMELTNGEYHQLKEHGLQKMPLKAKAEFYKLDKVFDDVAGWEELRQELSNIGLEVRRKGRGGVLHDKATGQTLKLSRIDSDLGRNQSLGRLEKRFGSRKEFEKVLEAHKELKTHLPDKEIRTNFGKFARAQFGSRSMKKASKKSFKKALTNSLKIGKAVKGLTKLAALSNPISGIAKMGLKMAKGISKQIQKSKQIENSNDFSR
jgi:hypothetical protein